MRLTMLGLNDALSRELFREYGKVLVMQPGELECPSEFVERFMAESRQRFERCAELLSMIRSRLGNDPTGLAMQGMLRDRVEDFTTRAIDLADALLVPENMRSNAA